MRIAIVGATGMIGAPVTNALASCDFEVIALVRDIDKAAERLDARVRLVQGDLRDVDSLSRAFEGADIVYISISTRDTDRQEDFSPENGGLENILAAAEASGVGRVAYLSSLLARDYQGAWWVMKAKREGIDRVRASGLAHTIFYPSNFMDNFTSGMVHGDMLMLAGSHQHQCWWIASEDYARQVVNAFKMNVEGDREYVVQGPEAMGMDEAAHTYVEHTRSASLRILRAPMFLLQLAGLVIRPLDFVAKLMTVMNNNEEHFEAQRTWDDLGTPTVTLALFAGCGAQSNMPPVNGDSPGTANPRSQRRPV